MSKKKAIAKNGKLVLIENGEKEILGNLIEPVEYRTNIDTNVESVYLKFNSNGGEITKKITRDKINKSGISKLTKFGADSWEDTVEYHVKFIRQEMVNAKKTYEHSDVGLGMYKDKRIIKLQQGIGIKSKYNGSKYNIKPTGSYDKWLKVINEEVVGNRYLEFSLVVGFVSMVINLLAEEENTESIIVNFCGTSSTGKTLATKLALSSWGYPNILQEGLLRSWYGTDQGILANLSNNYGIPIGFDDTSLQSNDKDYTEIIYQMVNGQTKAAKNQDGSDRAMDSWRTAVISSSEKSIIESTDSSKKGISVRIFELKVEQITTSAENAENIEKVIMKNYGHSGVEFSKGIVDIDSKDLSRRLHEIREELLEEMEQDSLSKRIALKLAIIQLTGELVKEILDINIDLDTLRQTLIEMEEDASDNRDIADKAYTSLIEYFQTNLSRFFKNGENPRSTGRVQGKYYVDSSDRIKEIVIPQDEFDTIMRELGYRKEDVLSKWKESGKLSYESGRSTKRRVFIAGAGKIPTYCINVDDRCGEVISIVRSEETEDIEELERSM